MSVTPNYTGMHAALEQPGVFHDLHTSLTVDIRYYLAPRLPEAYSISVEKSLSMRDDQQAPKRYQPDVSIHHAEFPEAGGVATVTLTATAPAFTVSSDSKPQRFLSIRDGAGQLITTIEILSPANKKGAGFFDYRQKQLSLAAEGVNLVEIDLLRHGQRRWEDERTTQVDYLITVQLAGDPSTRVWTAGEGTALPVIPIPLRPADGAVLLPLETILLAFLEKSGLGKRLLGREGTAAGEVER